MPPDEPDKPPEKPGNIQEVFTEIVLRHLDIYFGGEVVLRTYARVCWTAAGSITMLAFFFAWRGSDPLLSLLGAVTGDDGVSPLWFMFFVVTISPLLLALVVGQSVLFGRPLRFFLIGFFLYGLLLQFVELPDSPDLADLLNQPDSLDLTAVPTKL